MRKTVAFCCLAILCLFLLPGAAYGYVDLSTGSTFLQILSALFVILAAGFVFFKDLLARLLRSLGKLLGFGKNR